MLLKSKKIQVHLNFFSTCQHIIMEQQENKGFSITSDYECIYVEEVFTELLSVLMTYAHKLIGNSTLRLTKSKDELAYDFSMEAIKRHLENPEKFNPKRNKDLVKYLKFYILKQLVSNFKELKGQKNEVAFDLNDQNGIRVQNAFLTGNDIHDQIDLNNALKLIRYELNENPILMELFELRYTKEYSRAEVCEKLEISTMEYTNRIRRLDTVMNRFRKQQEN